MTSTFIIYHAMLDLPICTSERCGYALESHSVKRHLRRSHGLSQTDADVIDVLVETERKNAAQGPFEYLAERQKYVATTLPSYTAGPTLPPIAALAITNCFKCANCGYIAPKEDSVRKHCATHLGTPLFQVPSQTIYGGNRRKYFEVFSSDKNSNSCALSVMMRDLQGSKPSDPALVHEDISHMDAFLSTMRFDKHLEGIKLSMHQAALACRANDADLGSFIKKIISAYHKRGFDITEKKVYTRCHIFMDSELSLAVSKKTVELYESRMCRLLAFVFNCCLTDSPLVTHFPKDLIPKIKALARDLSSISECKITLLHSLLYTLFFLPIQEDNDSILIFISCCSVIQTSGTDSLRFANSSDLSPMLAALKHFARCTVVMDVYGFGSQDSRLAWKRIAAATESNADTGIQYVQFCMKTCNRIRNGEVHRVRLVVCPRHPLCAIVDGVELSLSDLGSKMRGIQTKAWSLLRQNVLNGLKLNENFWAAADEMQDSLTDLTPGYWFGMHTANHHHVEYWSNALLASHRSDLFEDGELNQELAKKFLQHCEDLQAFIYVLMQTCSGAPARASELGIVRICNTTIGPRNIFCHGGHIFTVISYHKCRNMDDGSSRPVVRYPDSVTAGLLMVYLMVVRPLENAVVEAFQKTLPNSRDDGGEGTTTSSAGQIHRDYLFSSRGQPLTTNRLRYSFEKIMKNAGIPITTSQYRQYHSGAVKNFLGEVDKDQLQGSASTFMLHNQAGHSERTAHQVYGVSDLDMRRLTATEMEGFRQASKGWHEALGMVHGRPRAPEDAISETDRQQATSHTPPESLEEQSLPAEFQSQVFARLARLETDTSQTNVHLQEVRESVSQILGHISTYFRDAPNRKRTVKEAVLEVEPAEPHKKLCPSPSPSSLESCLRQFLGIAHAKFQSRSQEKAVSLAVRADSDALIVLPTGGGKSLTFMLSAYMHMDKVIVVIVPLVALQLDLIRRCQEAGVQANRWDSRDVAGARIIVASVEHTSSKRYEAFIRELEATKRLHAIFVDEAHLVLLWQKFRQPMRSLHRFVRPESVKAPLIALTATAPPSIENAIASACGLSAWTTVRQNTSRSNIRYEVRDVGRDEMLREVDGVLHALFKQYTGAKCRAIVYVQTRADCDTLRLTLTALSPRVPCFKYHAGMPDEERIAMQSGWKDTSDGKAHVMVATSAFGCGIDIPTVRIVLHAGSPRSLVEFLQESGRAGRDGKPASSIVFNTNIGNREDVISEDRLPLSPDAANGMATPLGDWNEEMFGEAGGLSKCTSQCRRWLLDAFVDGSHPTKTCMQRGMELCDFCRSSGAPANAPLALTHSGTPTSSPLRPNSSALGTDSSGAKSTATSATAHELMDGYGSRVPRNMCPICTVKNASPMMHAEGSDEKSWTCYKSRCLRCARFGHDARKCKMFKADMSGCRACGFRTFQGSRIHKSTDYGKIYCPNKKLLCIALLCWEDEKVRCELSRHLPEVASISTVEAFEQWLRGPPCPNGDSENAGLASFVPWFFMHFLRMPV